jgi:ethanolamine transporter EutH
MNTFALTLDQQREEFSQRRFLAMPLAGAICWSIAGISSIFISTYVAAWVLFIATGSIVYLAMLLTRFTGEDFFRKDKPKNSFDGLFLRCIAMAALVYSIAIPFFMIDKRSLPLSIGILTGLMWLPFSWIIQHWIGTFHTICRTLLIVAAWYIFPQQSFSVIPALVVIVYIISIYTLEMRWRKLSRHHT